MKFPYIKVTDFPRHQKRERWLPWMRVGISNPKGDSETLYPLGLVDSGSDITIVDREIGEKQIIYEDWVAFTYKKFPRSMPQQTAIFGTLGFFRHLEVTFQYPKWIIANPRK